MKLKLTCFNTDGGLAYFSKNGYMFLEQGVNYYFTEKDALLDELKALCKALSKSPHPNKNSKLKLIEIAKFELNGKKLDTNELEKSVDEILTPHKKEKKNEKKADVEKPAKPRKKRTKK